MTSKPVILVDAASLEGAVSDPAHRIWIAAHGFAGQRGRLIALPDAAGGVACWLLGLGDSDGRTPFLAGHAGAALPPGRYRLEGAIEDRVLAAVGFRLGAHRFAGTPGAKPAPELEVEPEDAAEVDRLVHAATLARDLVETPANRLGPETLEARARDIGALHGMAMTTVSGRALDEGFPLIAMVGRAGAEAPRLLDMTWGDPDAPKVTLVGKGVTFDTGGLDIKSSSGMLLMKKDMGGAANVLGLAHLIADARLDVRLRVLLPIVENAIAGNAFRPGDVVRSRKGFTVEIGNTDAEGRLILADALSLADEEAPDVLIDMATLTGAARVALGPDLPPLYARPAHHGPDIAETGLAQEDPLWPMPLWQNYRTMFKSRIADLNNAGQGGFAGSITAALFLERFVEKAANWVHLDIYAWAPEARPGRPVGATEQGQRALYAWLKARYGVRPQ